MKNRVFSECVDFVGAACKPFLGHKKYISTGAVDIDHISEADVEIIDYDRRPSRANLEVSKGDVLFAKMQGTKKTLVIDEVLSNNVYSTGFCAVRAKKGIITDKCLYHLLSSQFFLNQKDNYCSGATQKAITNAGLNKITIRVPDYFEQDTIASQLDAITKIISQRLHELQSLDNLIKARFVEMFGDPRTNPNGYVIEELRSSCSVITGNTPPRSVEEYYGEYIEWIKTDNIVSGRTNPTYAAECLSEEGMKVGRTVDEGAILMVCIAGSIASIGRVCITDRRMAFNQQINAVIPNHYDVRFLYVMLKISKDYLVEENNMALKGILSKSKLEDKVFYVPPMELQKQFATYVAHVDKSKAAVQQALDKAQLLFDSLMQQYFG